jgi:hypothetical protein
MGNRRQRTAFLEETLQAMAEHRQVLFRIDLDLRTFGAQHQRARQIFLDRHRCLVLIARQIDDRKPA